MGCRRWALLGSLGGTPLGATRRGARSCRSGVGLLVSVGFCLSDFRFFVRLGFLGVVRSSGDCTSPDANSVCPNSLEAGLNSALSPSPQALQSCCKQPGHTLSRPGAVPIPSICDGRFGSSRGTLAIQRVGFWIYSFRVRVPLGFQVSRQGSGFRAESGVVRVAALRVLCPVVSGLGTCH